MNKSEVQMLRDKEKDYITELLYLRSVIRYYADQNNWYGETFWRDGDWKVEYIGDGGKKAREALDLV